jgi:4-alpha-glucanotransferase
VLLCNPLHAVSPVVPVEPSPYYPSSRRFRSPLYLRVEQTPEYAAAPPELRAQVDALRPETAPDRIDRDTVWTAKLAALELLWPLARRDELRAYRAEQGEGLADFALFSALAERYGVPWQDWPAELRRPDGPAVRELAAELADRAEFHAWLQWLCDEQLAVAGAAARDAGMTVGIVHDLAVGVDPGGADAWGLQDVLAMDMTVGAPPDSFNQQGQDWRLPPWNPERLAEAGYAPYRDMLRAVLRSAGGVRIDHVMGLFRLWWIPAGASAADGTYVYYDDEALLGVLALEAYRAGALVVGEDLGTVEPRVSRTLAERNILGSAVLWFERDDDGAPLPPEKWREQVMASVTTHDLPTAAGFLADEHVRVRAELGQLGHSEAEERARVAKERDELLAMLRENGLLGPDPDPAEIVRAMHAVLARAPSRLVLAALGDAVGDLRQPNLPGTVDQYPNWRLPVADGTGRPVRLEELRSDLQVRRLAQLLAGVGDR